MDSSCAVLLIAAVTDTGDVGVNVAREVVEEEHTAHHVLELAASMCRRSFSAIAQSLFPNAGMAPPLVLIHEHCPSLSAQRLRHQPLPKAGATQERMLHAVGCSGVLGVLGHAHEGGGTGISPDPVRRTLDPTSLPFARLQKAQAYARFSATVGPPCFSLMM